MAVGPHIGLSNAWPMSLLVQARTSDDDEEITECLELVLRSAKLGLIHESVNVDMIFSYTSKQISVSAWKYRANIKILGSWFACKLNSQYLDLARLLLV